jgi:hypothetical protein
MTPKNDLDALRDRVQRLGFFGLLASWNDIAQEPWLQHLVTIEENERKRRSLERRLRAARIGSFKSMADFDWTWPSRVDREPSMTCSPSSSSTRASTPSSSDPTASARP